MGRPSASLARDTRREIMDAALDLFAEHGYHAASMRALARAVGVRESALYHHFPSKQHILVAVLAERMELRRQRAVRLASRLGDRSLADILTEICETILELVEQPAEKKWVRTVMSLGSDVPIELPQIIQMLQGPFTAIREVIDELQRTNRMRRDIPVEVFLSHVAGPLFIVSGALWPGQRIGLPIPIKRFIREHVAFLVRAVAPPPPAREKPNGRSTTRKR